MGIDAFGELKFDEPKEDIPLVDFDKIKNKKGQIGEASIEDVMLSLGKIKGNAQKGAGLFNTQGCVACHSITNDQVLKGPFMGQIGSIMNREQIAESILKPNASISQGFSTVQISTKGGVNASIVLGIIDSVFFSMSMKKYRKISVVNPILLLLPTIE